MIFYQYNWEDMERHVEVSRKIFQQRENGSDRFLKKDQVLFSHHNFNADLPKKSKDEMGFFIGETDNEDTLINFKMAYADLWDMKFIPLTDGRKIVRDWVLSGKDIFHFNHEK